jgi:hypothetical protein
VRVWWHGGKPPKARRDSTKEVKDLVKYHVGVDVGKNRHHVSIRDMPTGTLHKIFSISCDRTGFLKLVLLPIIIRHFHLKDDRSL